jgi:uncharacterized protein YutE (UPF0331/DUF86 family)
MDTNEKITRKLLAMKKYIDFLNSHQNVSVEELKDDYQLLSAIERNFQLVIESALDIGEIIISAEDFEKPEDYKSVILTLGKHEILPPEFAEEFALVAGFRNILVHIYEEVDIEKLHEFLNNLNDFDKFSKYIAQYLKK